MTLFSLSFFLLSPSSVLSLAPWQGGQRSPTARAIACCCTPRRTLDDNHAQPSSRTHAVDPEPERRSVSCHRASTSPLLLAVLLLMAFHDELAARSVSSPLRHPSPPPRCVSVQPLSPLDDTHGDATNPAHGRAQFCPCSSPRPSPFLRAEAHSPLPSPLLTPRTKCQLPPCAKNTTAGHHCRRQAKPPRSPYLRYSSVPIDPTEIFLIAP